MRHGNVATAALCPTFGAGVIVPILVNFIACKLFQKKSFPGTKAGLRRDSGSVFASHALLLHL